MLAQQAELSPDVAEELEAALLARLRDKLPAVRAEAAKALSMFADPGPVCSPRCPQPWPCLCSKSRGCGGAQPWHALCKGCRPWGQKCQCAERVWDQPGVTDPGMLPLFWLQPEQTCELMALRSRCVSCGPRGGAATSCCAAQQSAHGYPQGAEGQALGGRTPTLPAARCATACWRCCERKRTRYARSQWPASPCQRTVVCPNCLYWHARSVSTLIV